MSLRGSSQAGRQGPFPVLSAGALLLPLFLSGCVAWAVWGRPGRERRAGLLKFSHARHADHVGSCAVCHAAGPGREVGPAGHAACAPCHPGAVPAATPARDCLTCHYTLAPAETLRAARPDYAAVSFGHPAHATVACAICHGKPGKLRSARHMDFPRMEDCLDCHVPGRTETAAVDCRLCHPGLSPAVRPASHAPAGWRQTHGKDSHLQPELCRRCHTPSRDCDQCHQRERPSSHNAGFRLKAHGSQAMSNPLSCETCHRQDVCEACHRTTSPPTHTASFRLRPWQHCAVCHLPLADGNRCSVCHHREPHAGVTALGPPPGLVASGRIRLDGPCLPCHLLEGGPRIPHPYNSVTPYECILCHRPR